MNLLGIDFGLRKIGLALAQEDMIQLLEVVSNSDKVFSKIAKICQQNKIEKIIIGLPEGKLAPEIKRFSFKLSKLCGLPIDFQNETLTTREAIAKMIERGKRKKERRRIEDAAAAACILENYLEERRVSV